MNIRYFMPTKTFLEENCVSAHAGEIKALGKKALIVTGAHSARVNGSLDDVTAVLEKNGQSYDVYDKVMSNPTIDCVYAGAAAARSSGADFIIAIGGGSPMDASKAIALLAVEDIPREKLFSGNYEKRLPLCCVPTTAGTGSEVTQYSVLTNDAVQSKTSLASPLLFPDLALLDGKYLAKLPKNSMINTVLDSLSHSAESFLSVRSNDMTEAMAHRAIEIISPLLPKLTGELGAEQCDRLMYASMLGGVVIAQTGTTMVHAMGYSLTYFRNVDHGRANGLLLAAYMKLAAASRPECVNKILSAAGKSSIDDFRRDIDALLGEKEMLSDSEIEKFTAIAAGSKNMTNSVVRPTECEIAAMYGTLLA